jgi:hypothetical protein
MAGKEHIVRVTLVFQSNVSWLPLPRSVRPGWLLGWLGDDKKGTQFVFLVSVPLAFLFRPAAASAFRWTVIGVGDGHCFSVTAGQFAAGNRSEAPLTRMSLSFIARTNGVQLAFKTGHLLAERVELLVDHLPQDAP